MGTRREEVPQASTMLKMSSEEAATYSYLTDSFLLLARILPLPSRARATCTPIKSTGNLHAQYSALWLLCLYVITSTPMQKRTDKPVQMFIEKLKVDSSL